MIFNLLFLLSLTQNLDSTLHQIKLLETVEHDSVYVFCTDSKQCKVLRFVEPKNTFDMDNYLSGTVLSCEQCGSFIIDEGYLSNDTLYLYGQRQ